MTFRKSILFSLSLHLLLFGTGITFARFAGDLLQGRHDPIMVALIGREGMSTSGNEAKTAAPPAARKIVPNKEVLHEPVPVQQEAPVPVPASDTVPVPQVNRQPHGEGTAVDQDAQQHASGVNGESIGQTSAAAGSSSGSVSSEQWAVIVSSIERAKNYPRLARERGIEGIVRLRFRVRPQGDVDRVEIVKSSGSEVLDSASVRTVYRAGPMPYVSGWVEVPIAYVLK